MGRELPGLAERDPLPTVMWLRVWETGHCLFSLIVHQWESGLKVDY